MATETKTVLGRVFTLDTTGPECWRSTLSHGRELRLSVHSKPWIGTVSASFFVHGNLFAQHFASVAIFAGDQLWAEEQALLALQGTLRKMAELEVAK